MRPETETTTDPASLATLDLKHTEAWADTGDAYSLTKITGYQSWRVSCLWCPFAITARTKTDAEHDFYDRHMEVIRHREQQRAAHFDL